MGGPNLEVFKFGMYIMFPIGFMYYFGTNLETRFSVPDFWPRPEATYKIPFDREEIQQEIEHQRLKRLQRRKERMERDSMEGILAERSAGGGTGRLPWWFPGDLRQRMEAERTDQVHRTPHNHNEIERP